MGVTDIEVTLYGSLADVAGRRRCRIRVRAEGARGPTVRELRAALVREVPALAPYLDHAAIGRGTELLPDDGILESHGASDEIAVLPPVSGG